MALNVEMVTFDCSDPANLADWRAEQFEGRRFQPEPGECAVAKIFDHDVSGTTEVANKRQAVRSGDAHRG